MRVGWQASSRRTDWTWGWRIHTRPVGAVHRGQRIDDDLQLRCDQSGVVVSEQPMGGLFEHAALAAPTAVEFGFRAATDAVDVELDATTAPAGGAVIDDAGQHAFVPAGADPGRSFCCLVAVSTDRAVRPGGHQFVVAFASGASDRPALRILRFAGACHRRPGRSESAWLPGFPASPLGRVDGAH